MTLGLLLGLGAAVAWGFTDVAGTFAGRRIGSLRALTGAQTASLVVLLAVATPAGGLDAVTRMSVSDLALCSVLGLAAMGAYLAFFTALRIGPLAVVSPTVAAYGGLTVVLAVLLRGETPTMLQAGGAALSTIGVILVGLVSDGGIRATRIVGRGVPLGVVALVLFAVVTIGLADPIGRHGWLAVIVVSRVANAAACVGLLVFVLAVGPRWASPLLATNDDPARATRFVVAAGVLDLAGFVSYAIGLERAETWIVGLASSFGPVVAVLVGLGFLDERLRPSQWLGLGLVGVGLVAVAVQ
ncbi:MAG TPA: DMT family transporter [Candidatus Limnocylindrales bacterium]